MLFECLLCWYTEDALRAGSQFDVSLLTWYDVRIRLLFKVKSYLLLNALSAAAIASLTLRSLPVRASCSIFLIHFLLIAVYLRRITPMSDSHLQAVPRAIGAVGI